MTDATPTSRILTLVFTDLADSTALKTQRGDQAVGQLMSRHRAHAQRIAADAGGCIIDWAGDGCFLTFETASAAVLFALRLQQVHREEPDLPSVRTGIHMGEVSERPGPDFKYRGGNLDLKKVGAALGARYLVEGSVRRAGDRIRVTAQLIDAPSGEHIWAETYDREVKDLFALQDEISATIAASLVGDLNRAEAERARHRGTENLEAWSLYELAMQCLDRLGSKDLAEARGLFERAVALDPQFADGAGATRAHALVGGRHGQR